MKHRPPIKDSQKRGETPLRTRPWASGSLLLLQTRAVASDVGSRRLVASPTSGVSYDDGLTCRARGGGRPRPPAPRVCARSRSRQSDGRDRIQAFPFIAFLCRDAAGPRQGSLAATEGTRRPAASSVGLRGRSPTDARSNVARGSLAGVMGHASACGAVRVSPARARVPLARLCGDCGRGRAWRRPPRALPRGGGPGEPRGAAPPRDARTQRRSRAASLGGMSPLTPSRGVADARRRRGGAGRGRSKRATSGARVLRRRLPQRARRRRTGASFSRASKRARAGRSKTRRRNSRDPSPQQEGKAPAPSFKNKKIILKYATSDACGQNQYCCRSALRQVGPRRLRWDPVFVLPDSCALGTVPGKERDHYLMDDRGVRILSLRRDARVSRKTRPRRLTAGTPLG